MNETFHSRGSLTQERAKEIAKEMSHACAVWETRREIESLLETKGLSDKVTVTVEHYSQGDKFINVLGNKTVQS